MTRPSTHTAAMSDKITVPSKAAQKYRPNMTLQSYNANKSTSNLNNTMQTQRKRNVPLSFMLSRARKSPNPKQQQIDHSEPILRPSPNLTTSASQQGILKNVIPSTNYVVNCQNSSEPPRLISTTSISQQYPNLKHSSTQK